MYISNQVRVTVKGYLIRDSSKSCEEADFRF